MYRVVIADDHALVAESIRARVESFSRCTVLADLRNGKQLLNHLNSPKNIPDLILLDINMPVLDGFQTMARLAKDHPTVRVLALTMEDDEDTFVRMIEAGANGLVSKSASADVLEQAIYEVMEKGHYYDPEMAKALFDALRGGKVEGEDILNDQEKELLRHICKELTYKEIADIMCVSPKTVDGYRHSLFQKLGVKSRVGLAMYAVKEGYHSV